MRHLRDISEETSLIDLMRDVSEICKSALSETSLRRWVRHLRDASEMHPCRLGRHYGVSKTSVSFKYQLKRLCDVFSWSVTLRYQLVCRDDVSNWSVLFAYQTDVTKTSQIGPTNSRTSCDVMMMSQDGLGRSS